MQILIGLSKEEVSFKLFNFLFIVKNKPVGDLK
jgi:hypothetical protein